MTATLDDRPLDRFTTVLFGENGGRYPDANALLVRGTDSTLLIDPALGVLPRLGSLPEIDEAVLSHCHEDHLPGLASLETARCWCHREDVVGLQDLESFLDLYGLAEPRRSQWRDICVERFHYRPRPDALPFEDGHLWELGGVTVRALHTPGHTRGHCALEVQPGDVLFLADIDLSSFGPYYGDAWSDLESFERTLEKAQGFEARFYVCGHHIGVLEGRDAYLARLQRYRDKLAEREQRLLSFLAVPRTLDDIVAHRFVYRPHDQVPGADGVERRSMTQHLDRLLRDGAVEELDGGRYVVG